MKYFDFLSSSSIRPLLFILFIVTATTSALARPGDLDSLFGDNGVVIKRWGAGEDTYKDVVQLPDGKIMVLAKDGAFNVILARYNANGTIDTTFDFDGFAIHSMGSIAYVNAMALQADGKILAAGSRRTSSNDNEIMVLRFNPDGSLDNNFAVNGKFFFNLSGGADEYGEYIRIQPDGSILVVASSFVDWGDISDMVIMRLWPSGVLDPTFDGDGLVFTGLAGSKEFGSAVDVLPDGKLIAIGSSQQNLPPRQQRLLIAKYNSNGSPDTSFGVNGVKTHFFGDKVYPTPTAMLVQPDGKIVACVNLWFTEVSTVMRFLPDGSFDTGFGNGGQTVLGTSGSYLYDVVIQPDQKLLAVGLTNLDLQVARLNTNGSLDTSFGNGGSTTVTIPGAGTEYAWGADLQKDGKLLVAGDFSFSLTDYDSLLMRFEAYRKPSFDYDGDGRSDVSVFRPSSGDWYLLNSQAGYSGQHFGATGDLLAPADLDGDGKTDVAVFRASVGGWYWLNSSNGSFSAATFGQTGDLPTPADYDGDGKADISVFRPSTGDWYRMNSSNGQFVAVHFGSAEDKPAVGDFDGDGKADISVFRPSTGGWYRLDSSTGSFIATNFGISEDKPTPADYDGDGKTDISVYRPSVGDWYRLNSSTGAFAATHFGGPGDKPAAADFDGDGKADITVFRPSDGNWYQLNTTAGFAAVHFGISEDLPTPNAFVY